MGLKLTLKKEDNSLFNDFIDAYWKISRLYYTPTVACFELSCYPSRDASKMELVPMSTPSLPIGGANKIAYEIFICMAVSGSYSFTIPQWNTFV